VSEPLYIGLCYLALALYKVDRFVPLLFVLYCAAVTRIEGLSIVGTVGLCHLLQLKPLRAALTSLAFLGLPTVFALHKLRFGDYFAYFDHNKQLLYRFHFLNPAYCSKQYLFYCSSFVLYVPFFVFTFVLITHNRSLGIYSLVYFIFGMFIFHLDIFRYALPGYTLALLISFDSVLNSPIIRNYSKYIVCAVLSINVIYSFGNIYSNGAETGFLYEVLGWEWKGAPVTPVV
jgi:hypothetical protein